MHIIKESEFMQLYDKSGKFLHGRIYFINDSIIRILHPNTKTFDTVSIANIQKIKIKSIPYFLKGYAGLMLGGVSLMLGLNILLLEKEIVRSEQLNGIIGFGTIVTSVILLKKSASLMGGKWISAEKRRFFSYSSQQKSLKKKPLKRLFYH